MTIENRPPVNVARFDIRLLGEVSILVDGSPRKLLPQTAKALAMLVSARNPVPQSNLAAALGQSPGWPVPDVAPPLSRLRQALAGGALDIPPAKWSHAYELVEREHGYLAATLDAARFETRLREGRELYDDGDLPAAMAALRSAAGEWRGAPFASLSAGWSLPWVCETYRAKLEEQRKELIRLVARVALRLGRHEEAAFLAEGPVGEGAGDTTAMWLLRFLTTLREDGATAAREVVGRRRERSRGDEAARRAEDLLLLHEHGFDVHAPLGGGGEETGEHGGPPVLVGRRREVLELSRLADRLRGGDAVAMALCGPGGIGKTRLLREAARLAARAGVPAVTVTCHDLDALRPWRELAGAVWSHLRRDLASVPEPISAQERDTLEKLMTAGTTGSPARPGHERDPRELTFLLVSLLRRAAGRGLLVGFDNAHLLSPYAEELLQHVRRGLGPVPVGFLLTTRSEAAHWKEAMDTVTVSPLTEQEVGQWLSRTWRRRPTAGEIEEAARVTAGLPLALCALTEAGDLRPAPAGPDAKAGPAFPWLAAAAITALGQDIDTALVARMLELEPDEADHALALAAAGGTVTCHDRVRFAHDRSREAVLEELGRDPALARDLHRRAFESLTERTTTGGWADPALPVRVALHATAAGAAVPDERAAAACLDAARAEQRGFAVEGATAWAQAGLRLRCDAATRAGLLITLGDALSDAGDMDEAGRRYLSAHQAAEGLPALAAAAVIRLARRWSAPGRVDRQLVHLLRGGLAALEHDDGEEAAPLRLQLQAHLAKKQTMAVAQSADDPVPDGPPPGVELARATLRELPPGADGLVRCEVLNECRWALYDHAHPRELLGISARLREAGVQAGSAYFHSEGLVALAIDQLRLGLVSDALGTVDDHRRHVARNPRALGPWLQNTLDTVMDLWNGDFQRAEDRLMGESLRMVQELTADHAVPAETLWQTWMGQHYWLLYERGRMEELFDSGLARQIEQHAYFPIWRAAHVLALCETGRHDEAADRLTAIVRETSGLAALPPHGWSVATLALLAESCALIAESTAFKAPDPGRAGLPEGPEHAGGTGPREGTGLLEGTGLEEHIPLLRARLAAHPEEIALAGWPTVLFGPTARSRGLLAMVAGDVPEALRRFDEATRMVSAAPPHMARLQLDRAMALRLLDPSDPTGEATRLLHRSLRLADRLGMPRLAAKARTLLTAS
ncbi:AAA family ATPase [Sphaerisporangium perillae]|uniref:AAA family ATPase n=1 Tax=Sphaerisporangium perillae TaxID=2935860 RepID=UPI002010415A|nr:AAA family ATPase [Sphaerisporangium perillae]